MFMQMFTGVQQLSHWMRGAFGHNTSTHWYDSHTERAALLREDPQPTQYPMKGSLNYVCFYCLLLSRLDAQFPPTGDNKVALA